MQVTYEMLEKGFIKVGDKIKYPGSEEILKIDSILKIDLPEKTYELWITDVKTGHSIREIVYSPKQGGVTAKWEIAEAELIRARIAEYTEEKLRKAKDTLMEIIRILKELRLEELNL